MVVATATVVRIRIRCLDFEASLEGLNVVLTCETPAAHEEEALLREVTNVRSFKTLTIEWIDLDLEECKGLVDPECICRKIVVLRVTSGLAAFKTEED